MVSAALCAALAAPVGLGSAPWAAGAAATDPVVVAGPMDNAEFGTTSWEGSEQPIAALGAFSVYATRVHPADDGSVYVADYSQVIRIDPGNGTFRRAVGSMNGWYPAGLRPIDSIGLDLATNELDLAVPLRGLDTDGQGRLVFSDRGAVFRIGADNRLEHVGGNGTDTSGGDGGIATAAGMDAGPVEVDGAGNIWSLDGQPGAALRRIDATSGVISTVAGTGTPGSTGDGGPATAAEIRAEDVAVAPNGDVLLVGRAWDPDTGDEATVIRRITVGNGQISSLLAPGACLLDAQPFDARVEGAELLYVGRFGSDAERYDCRIDLVTGAASATPLGLAGRDIRSNVDRAGSGPWFYTEFNDVDPTASGLVRLGALPAGVQRDLSVAIDGPTSGVVGGWGDYSITITNTNPSTATGVAVHVATTNLDVGMSGPCTSTGVAFDCLFGTLAPGQTETLSLPGAAFLAEGAASIEVQLSSSSVDTNPANNVANLAIAVTAGGAGGNGTMLWRNSSGIVRGEPGGPPSRITSEPGQDPRWSPDRSRIAMLRDRPSGQPDIYTMNADGSNGAFLTDDEGAELGFAWSPDGSQLVFSSGRDNSGGWLNLWAIPTNGGTPTRLTQTPGSQLWPAWSPDGSRIAYVTLGDAIRTIRPDGTGATVVHTAAPGSLRDISWSPAGDALLFAEGSSVRRVAVDRSGNGSDPVVLVEEQQQVRSPDYSPDGLRLAYVTDGAIRVANADGSDPNTAFIDVGSSVDWSTPTPDPTPPPELAMTLGSPGAAVVTGSTFSASGTASNVGAGAAAGTFIDISVDNATLGSARIGTDPCTPTGPTTATCELGSLPAGASRPLTVAATATAADPGSATVTALVRCACASDSAVAVATRSVIAEPAVPSLWITGAGPATVYTGDAATYAFTVRNDLNGRAAGVVASVYPQLWMTPPAVWSAVTITKGTCTAAGVCTIGDLAAGEIVTITATVAVSAVHGKHIEAIGALSCSCADPFKTDNRHVVTSVSYPRSDLRLGITNPTSVSGGQPIVWNATLDGLAPNDVRDIVVELTIPEGVTVTRVVAANGGVCRLVGATLRCTQDIQRVPWRITVYATAQHGGSFVLVGRLVSCWCDDVDPANNSATAAPVSHPLIGDLTITKSGPSDATTGQPIVWTITVTNTGPDDVPATVTDTMAAALAAVAAVPSQGACGLVARTVTCSLGVIAAGATASIELRAVSPKPITTLLNTARVACAGCYDPVAGTANLATAGPTRVWWTTRPATVTGCEDVQMPSVCILDIRLHNDNTVAIPAGTIEIGGIDPATGPRLDLDTSTGNGFTCSDLGTSIWCSGGSRTIPVGGTAGPRLVLVPPAPSTFTLSVTHTVVNGRPQTTGQPPRAAATSCVGGEVLFESDDTGDLDIYAARMWENPATSWTNLTQTPGIEEGGAAWGPEGDRFAFHRGKPNQRRLWIATLDDNGCIDRQWRVPNQPRADSFMPDWSPTAPQLAFTSKAAGNDDIWVLDLDGSDLRRLTSSSRRDTASSFSRDGTTIAFSSQRDPAGASGWNIWSVRTDGTNERHLSFADGGFKPEWADFSPSFSRGRGPERIVFHTAERVSGSTALDWNLWSMAPDGTGKVRVSGPGGLDDKNVDTSASGTHLVFDAGTGTSGIWVMDDLGTRTPVAQTPSGIDQAPSVHRVCMPAESSGGVGTYVQDHEVGATSGSFWLRYETFSVPDRITVHYEGAQLFTTESSPGVPGPVGTNGWVTQRIPYGPGASTTVTVTVEGDPDGTAWEYQIC